MALVNLTPHTVTLIIGESTRDIPPSGTVARCTVQREQIDSIALWADCPDAHSDEHNPGSPYLCGACGGQENLDVPITRSVFGAVEGLPDPAPRTHYIVSRVVAEAARDRRDLLVPDDTVRDEQGRIIGCRALARV